VKSEEGRVKSEEGRGKRDASRANSSLLTLHSKFLPGGKNVIA